MQAKKLRLYRIDMKYIRDLSKEDDNVPSVSPQIGKDTRPFVGIVIPHGEIKYCIPLSSPKPKHEQMKNGKDFSKILDSKGKLIGVLNFNNMVPVCDDVLIDFDIAIRESDDGSERAYKHLMKDQLRWCNENREAIERKAAKLYAIVTEEPCKMKALKKRCCDFKKLELIMEKRFAKPDEPPQEGESS